MESQLYISHWIAEFTFVSSQESCDAYVSFQKIWVLKFPISPDQPRLLSPAYIILQPSEHITPVTQGSLILDPILTYLD